MFVSSDHGNSWEEINSGLSDLNVYSLAANDSYVFAGTKGGGVFRSSDNGASWFEVNFGLTNLRVLALSFTDAYLLAGTEGGGIFRSLDNGASWSVANSGIPGSIYVRALASAGARTYAALTTTGVYVSTNNGTSWSPAMTNGSDANALAVHLTVAFVGTFGAGVFRSTNNGQNWVESNNGIIATSIRSMVITNSGLFAGGFGSGVHRTTNNGMTWTASNTNLIDRHVSNIVARSDTLYAATAYGVSRSTNNGANWSTYGLTNPALTVRALAFSQTYLTAGAYGGINSGVYRRREFPSTWAQVLANKDITALLTPNDSTIFAGTEQRLYRTTNSGTGWDTVLYHSVTCLVSGNGYLFAGGADGIFRSNDNGTTWQPAGFSESGISTLLMHGSTLFAGGYEGVHRSVNNGNNWTAMSHGWPPSSGASSLIAADTNIFAGIGGAGVYRDTFRPPPSTIVVTHGFLPNVVGPPKWSDYKWRFCMADAVSPMRQLCIIRHGKVYQTQLQFNDFATINNSFPIDNLINGYFADSLILDPSRDIVFVVDWVEESDRNTHGYSEAAGDALAATLIQTARQFPWLLENLHFIGHSRGTVVNSECIQRLLYFSGNLPPTVSLDQDIHMTTLDPHPAGHWLSSAMADDNVNSPDITHEGKRIGVVGWKNGNYRVAYIDNFYQTLLTSLFWGLDGYPGSRRNQSLNQELGLLTLSGHSLVHTWYHGTVDLSATNDEFNNGSGYDIKRNDWYLLGGSREWS